MEENLNKVIVVSASEFPSFLQPILLKLQKLEDFLYKGNTNKVPIYTETEAAAFLKCSKKKLQNMRNARRIGFIRENGGRSVLYRYEHLMEYLAEHELKKKR